MYVKLPNGDVKECIDAIFLIDMLNYIDKEHSKLSNVGLKTLVEKIHRLMMLYEKF